MRRRAKSEKRRGAFLSLIGIALTLCIVMTGPTWAKDKKIRALTQDNVKAFIKETTHLTKSQDEFLSPEKITAYLNKHLEDGARFISTITYIIPEMPPQEATLSFNKAQFIEAVGAGTKNIQAYKSKVEITEIKISWGKKTAHIKTNNTETGFMSVPTEEDGAGEDVPIEGHSKCAQTVTLNKGVIQMSTAVCKTEVKFLEY